MAEIRCVLCKLLLVLMILCTFGCKTEIKGNKNQPAQNTENAIAGEESVTKAAVAEEKFDWKTTSWVIDHQNKAQELWQQPYKIDWLAESYIVLRGGKIINQKDHQVLEVLDREKLIICREPIECERVGGDEELICWKNWQETIAGAREKLWIYSKATYTYDCGQKWSIDEIKQDANRFRGHYVVTPNKPNTLPRYHTDEGVILQDRYFLDTIKYTGNVLHGANGSRCAKYYEVSAVKKDPVQRCAWLSNTVQGYSTNGETEEERIKYLQNNNWPQEIKTRLAQGEIALGITTEMAKAAYGESHSESTKVKAGKEIKILTFHGSGMVNASIKLTFVNDKLDGWEE